MLRNVDFDDFSDILKIQDACYSSEYVESLEILLKHFNRYPKGCQILEYEQKPIGFFISFPFLRGVASESVVNFPKIDECNCFYIHDFVILPNFQSKGLSKIMIKKILEISDYNIISLASVPEQSVYWAKNGFQKTEEKDLGRSKVIMMEKTIN